MNTPGRITGSLLILAMVQTVQAEAARVPPEAQHASSAPSPKRAVADDVQSRRDKVQQAAQQPKQERLSPEDRRKLRRDINEAGRDIYQREPSRRY